MAWEQKLIPSILRALGEDIAPMSALDRVNRLEQIASMRILALLTDAFGSSGGIGQYNRDLLSALAVLDGVQSITVLPRGGVSCRPHPKIEQLEGKSGRLAYSADAIKAARRSRPSAVLCGHIYLLPVCWLIARLRQVPLWLQVHGVDAWQRPPLISDDMLWGAVLVTSVSRYTRRRFLGWAPISPSRVRVLPNTVSESFAPGNRESIRRELGYLNKTLLLTVGRLAESERYKGHDRVLRCLPELIRKFDRLHYLVVGDGDDLLRLRTLAAELDVHSHVEFLGSVPFEKLKALYGAADLFVMPSTGEGFGIVFLEAMASGTPALGLDADGSCDPLRDGDLGYVASASGLCDSLVKALDEIEGSPPVGGLLHGATGQELSDLVQATFGRSAFERQVARLVGLLAERLAA